MLFTLSTPLHSAKITLPEMGDAANTLPKKCFKKHHLLLLIYKMKCKITMLST